MTTALAAFAMAVTSLALTPTSAWAATLTGDINPKTVVAHDTSTFHVSLATDGALIGQFTVYVPAAFTILSASNPQGGVLATATVDNTNNTVTVSGVLNTSVSVDVTTVDPSVAGPYTWKASAKDQLLGPIGSIDLPVVTVTAAPASALAFGQGPSNVARTVAMAPAVTVKAVDAYGNTDQNYVTPITLTYGNNPTGAAQPTGNTATPASGVATFSALTFPTAGFGYTLVPNSGTLTGPASSPFDVNSSITVCPANQPCDSGNVTGTRTQTSGGRTGTVTVVGRVQADAGPQADVLTTTMGGNQPLLSCSKFGPVMTFGISTRAKTITLTVTGPFAEGNDRGFDVSETTNLCYGAPHVFTTANGTPATFNAANNEYEGLLPSCNGAKTNTPCMVSRTDLGGANGSPDTTRYVARAAAGDPKIGP
jgi:hypothetical protein